MAAAARGESVTAEIWGTTGGPGEEPAVVLQSIQRNAYERGVGDSEEVARFEVCNSNEGKDLPPGGDKLLFN